MAVCSANTIGLEPLIDFTVERIDLGGATCSGYAGSGVSDDVFRVDQSFFQQRCKCQNDTSRIATRITYQFGALDLAPSDFRQAIDSLLQYCRVHMRFIPFAIDCRGG